MGRRMTRETMDEAMLARLPPEHQEPPAFKKLPSIGMKLFVVAVIEQGGAIPNWSRAYRQAGFKCDNVDTVKTNAWKLAHDPRVVEAMVEMAKLRMKTATIQAEAVLIEIMNSSENDKVRLDACKAILDRGGLHPMFESKLTLEKTISREEKLMRLYELAQKSGQNPRLFLGDAIDLLPEDYRIIDRIEGKDGAEAETQP